jgi:hypothetical protein
VAIDALLSLAHTMVSAPGTQAVLVGSGVSRSAQIPTGWEVTLDLVRRLGVLAGAEINAAPEDWYEDTYGEPPDYSVLLGSLAKTPAERRALLQGYFEPTEAEREAGAKLPTPAHRALARLAAQGFIRVILTTNFDRLIETALRDEGIEPIIVSTPDATDGAAPIVHQRCLLVKLHGDYLDDRIKNTESELATYDPRMDVYLDRILDEFGLIVCGWSGEWDPALRTAFERCKSRRYTTTWTTMSDPGSRASRLIALRGAQVVKISGADTFFVSLAEKVKSLAEMGTDSPLSVATAIASLKRYVTEERHRIRLEDLLMDEANRLSKRLREDFPFQGGPVPTLELAAERIRRMDAATEILRSLFFHGCRLATTSHDRLFLQTLALLAPPEDVAGYTIWTDMARYPMASIIYAGALGALAAENWGLLRRLLVFRYRVNGRDRIACDRLAAARALPTEAANALFQPQRRHTPVSDHLVELLAPIASQIHPDPQMLFDELEMWVAFAHLDVVRDLKAPPVWMPPGRFCWRGQGGQGRQPSILFAEAEAAGQEWPPLAAAWFGGRVDRWEEVKTAFSDAYGRLASAMW